MDNLKFITPEQTVDLIKKSLDNFDIEIYDTDIEKITNSKIRDLEKKDIELQNQIDLINDITTSENLLYNTKNLTAGKNTFGSTTNNYDINFYKDGFSYDTSNSNISFIIDQENFTNIKFSNEKRQNCYMYSPVISKPLKKGDQITISVEAKYEGKSSFNSAILKIYEVRKNSSFLLENVQDSACNFKINTEYENQWQQIKYVYTVPQDFNGIDYGIAIGFGKQTINDFTLYFKKPSVSFGKINNSEWTMNSSDIVQSSILNDTKAISVEDFITTNPGYSLQSSAFYAATPLMVQLVIGITNSEKITAETSINPCTLNSSIAPINMTAVCGNYGIHGTANANGEFGIIPTIDIPASSNIYITLTYILKTPLSNSKTLNTI